MRSIFSIWLIFAGTLMVLNCYVDAWNRHVFNRYSRNLLRNGQLNAAAGSLNARRNNELDELSALLGLGNDGGRQAIVGGGGGADALLDERNAIWAGLNEDAAAANNVAGQQQTEVYGIVEPLIEDLPCVDRPCNANDDCCPTGVCVNTYGEGKCIYVYGRKRDLCHRNTDCEPGMSCLKASTGLLMCQPTPPPPPQAQQILGSIAGEAKALQLKQFGEECYASIDCNVAKGMCCQLQRSHHRIIPKKICAYFRDPFMCIDIAPPNEDEGFRELRLLSSSFNQRRM